jgi:hypothetical protein
MWTQIQRDFFIQTCQNRNGGHKIPLYSPNLNSQIHEYLLPKFDWTDEFRPSWEIVWTFGAVTMADNPDNQTQIIDETIALSVGDFRQKQQQSRVQNSSSDDGRSK